MPRSSQKYVPNIEACDFIPAPLRTLTIKWSSIQIRWVKFCSSLYINYVYGHYLVFSENCQKLSHETRNRPSRRIFSLNRISSILTKTQTFFTDLSDQIFWKQETPEKFCVLVGPKSYPIHCWWQLAIICAVSLGADSTGSKGILNEAHHVISETLN